MRLKKDSASAQVAHRQQGRRAQNSRCEDRHDIEVHEITPLAIHVSKVTLSASTRCSTPSVAGIRLRHGKSPDDPHTVADSRASARECLCTGNALKSFLPNGHAVPQGTAFGPAVVMIFRIAIGSLAAGTPVDAISGTANNASGGILSNTSVRVRTINPVVRVTVVRREPRRIRRKAIRLHRAGPMPRWSIAATFLVALTGSPRRAQSSSAAAQRLSARPCARRPTIRGKEAHTPS